MTLWGQPPSMNHMYKSVLIPVTDKWGRAVYGPDGRPKLRRGLAKEEAVERYQVDMTMLTRVAKPKGWLPGGRVRVRYWFHLARDIDCDNAMKALNDAIAQALGVNDKNFLPCAQAKETGVADPRVEVEIENE